MRATKKTSGQGIFHNFFASISVHSRFKYIFLCLFVATIFAVSSAFAQQSGGIRGIVFDKEFDAPLAGAQVSIAETGQKVTATDEGNYIFSNVEPGRYTLVFSKEGYTRQVSTDVVVSGGQMTDVSPSLSGEFTEMEEFVAQDLSIGGNSEAGLLNLRMETPALMDSISADLMSRAGAGDAASALRLVSGATVQDGKYAVVRGLPDRYVNSQMNGVRLPSADPDKLAVQLDQFPSEMIESIQVSKTFTPDQQGDASGGAVNVVLKKVPDEPVLKVSFGTEQNSQVAGHDDFLTYEGGGVNQWGDDRGGRDIQWGSISNTWRGAVGAHRTRAPTPYNWSVTAGGKYELVEGLRIGGFANFYYKKSVSHRTGTDDAYWAESTNHPLVLVPQIKQGNLSVPIEPGDDFKTALFDITQSSEEVQWGGLGAIGIENDLNAVNLVFMRTQSTEDKVTIAEDTRGKEYFVTRNVPGYDPFALSKEYRDAAPYQRNQTLEYTERRTETLQLNSHHTVPVSDWGIPGVITWLEPEADWTVAKSESSLYQPDKRMFGELWKPGEPDFYWPGYPPWVPPQTIPGIPSGFYQNKPGSDFTLGNLQRVWKDISEESDQHFINVKLPFEQWSGDKGYLKFGVFNDVVKRKFRQDSFSNFSNPDSGNLYAGPELEWDESWAALFPSEYHAIYEADVDVDYDGKRSIEAWYYMADVPLNSFFKIIGGVRRERTKMSIVLDPDPERGGFGKILLPDGMGGATNLIPGIADVDFEETDDLPSIGFEFQPVEPLVFRASYSETIARQTFKEMTPVQQTEYLGGDVFMGNPLLEMSDVENYDLRLDFTPFEGSFISASWFRKRIKKPIEYVQDYVVNIGDITTPVNYPSGELDGYELEIRQQMGRIWRPLEGLSIGANGTLIHAVVRNSDEEALFLEGLGFPETERDMMQTPEYLYNLSLTYDFDKTGTQFGLFYTVKGDTLVAGAGQSKGNYIPSVYAKEHDSLNFSVSQKIGDHLKLTFKAKNLTDPDIQEVYRSDYMDDDVVKTSYTKGIDYSISLSGEF